MDDANIYSLSINLGPKAEYRCPKCGWVYKPLDGKPFTVNFDAEGWHREVTCCLNCLADALEKATPRLVEMPKEAR